MCRNVPEMCKLILEATSVPTGVAEARRLRVSHQSRGGLGGWEEGRGRRQGGADAEQAAAAVAVSCRNVPKCCRVNTSPAWWVCLSCGGLCLQRGSPCVREVPTSQGRGEVFTQQAEMCFLPHTQPALGGRNLPHAWRASLKAEASAGKAHRIRQLALESRRNKQ
jgi:hypothetical protein